MACPARTELPNSPHGACTFRILDRRRRDVHRLLPPPLGWVARSSQNPQHRRDQRGSRVRLDAFADRRSNPSGRSGGIFGPATSCDSLMRRETSRAAASVSTSTATQGSLELADAAGTRAPRSAQRYELASRRGSSARGHPLLAGAAAGSPIPPSRACDWAPRAAPTP